MIFYIILPYNRYFYFFIENQDNLILPCIIINIFDDSFDYNIINFNDILEIIEYFENYASFSAAFDSENGIRAINDIFMEDNNILPTINTDNLEFLECHEIFMEDEIINLVSDENIEDYLIDDEDWNYNSD